MPSNKASRRAGLASLRVLEISAGAADSGAAGVSASVAGKLLADLGAEVVKIEPPGGDALRHAGPFPAGNPDPEASGRFLYLNTNKRSLVRDLEAGEGRESLGRLAARADLLLHDLPPRRMKACGLDYGRLSASQPALVMLSITPFGLTGPYRDYAASDLTLIHGGGWGWICPGRGTPRQLPPIKPFGQHALIQAGLHGAVAALAAVRGARESGIGEQIDLSVQEVVAFLLGRHFSVYPYAGRVDSRLSPAVYEPMTFYPCKDGSIYLICPEQNQFERLVELMGNPAWARDARFSDREGREAHAEELKARLSEWTAGWEAEALYHACQKARVGAAPVFGQGDLERQEHLRSREFFVSHAHPAAGTVKLPGAPYRFQYPCWSLRSPAPALGEAGGAENALFGGEGAKRDNGSRASREAARTAGRSGEEEPVPLPLQGIRVLDLSWVWAGPHCTMMLALLGAEVIKVESSLRPDLTRRSHLFASDMEPGPNRNGYFNQINQGKLGIGVNLSTGEGVALVKELAARSDVMVSNFGTGVLERLGLGAEAMQQTRPGLIVAMISAFGQTGPCRHYMGYGPLIPPLAGISAETGYEDGAPRDVGLAYGDPNGGGYAAVSILASLLAREGNGTGENAGAPPRRAEGRGQVIDLSMWEAMICTGFEGWMNHALGNAPYRPMGNRSPTFAPHNLYRCAGEDEWVAIAVTGEEQWRALCGAVGRPELAEDPRFRDAPARKANEDALDERIGAWCAGRDRWEITRGLQRAGVAAFPSLDSRALSEDPHLRERGLFTHWPHAEVGVRKLVGAPWRLTRRPNGLGKAAPRLGEDTGSVLERLLGLDAPTLADLRARGIIE